MYPSPTPLGTSSAAFLPGLWFMHRTRSDRGCRSAPLMPVPAMPSSIHEASAIRLITRSGCTGQSIVSIPRASHAARFRPGSEPLAGLPPAFMAARYHSLAVDPTNIPAELLVTAMCEEDGVVMGLRHATLPLEGVQFHPESVLTPEGPHLLANFLRLAGEGDAGRLDAVSGSFATGGMCCCLIKYITIHFTYFLRLHKLLSTELGLPNAVHDNTNSS